MLCRIGLLLGRPPSEVRTLPVSDVQLLTLYWQEEPWGPVRDNMHAALSASATVNALEQVARQLGAKGRHRRSTWKDFMIRPREQAVSQTRDAVLSMFRMLGKPGAKLRRVRRKDKAK